MMMRAVAASVSRRGALMLLMGAVSMGAIAVSAQEKAAPEAKKAGPPAFTSQWKISLPADTRRVVVADVTGEGKPQLLALGAEGTLTVHKIVEGKPVKAASVTLGKDAARFVVGRFAKEKPAVIVAPGGAFYWEKGAFSQKPGPEAEGAFASMRLKDGSEALFVFSQGGPPSTFVVDLADPHLYKAGPQLPELTAEGSSIREIVLNFAPELFERAPFPDAVKKGGIARIFDPRSEDKLYGLFSWQEAESPFVAVIGGDSLFPEPKADMTPIWKSGKLGGKVRDIALGSDLKGTKATGFYVLQEGGAGQKECVLEFFALD